MVCAAVINFFLKLKKDLITTPESGQIASTRRLIVHEATIEPNCQIRAAVLFELKWGYEEKGGAAVVVVVKENPVLDGAGIGMD